MKASEFKKIVREEIEKSLKEQTQIKPNVSAKELKNTLTPILTKLEQEIDNASKNITIALTKKQKKVNPSYLSSKDIMVTRKGVEKTKQLIDVYNKVVDRANTYIDSLENPESYDEEMSQEVLAELKELLQKHNL